MDERYIYLDGTEERRELVEQVRALRGTLAQIANHIPETHHYTPRYNGVSLAVTLTRLQAFDTGALWLIKAASNGYSVRVPRGIVGVVDDTIVRMAQKRLVPVTLDAIQRKEREICEFIRTVPLDVLSKDVYTPGKRDPLTVEKALQAYFVRHWQHQLDLLEHADDSAIGTV